MNHRLLNRIKALVRREPDKMDMRTWAQKHPCGTVGCIAGHALMLSGWRAHFQRGCRDAVGFQHSGDFIYEVTTPTACLLGINQEMAEDLFITDWWPKVEQRAYKRGDKLSVVRMIERVQKQDPEWKKRNAGKVRKKKTSKAVC